MTTFSDQDVEALLISITTQLLKESGEARQKAVTLTASLGRHLGIDSLTRAELFRRIEKALKISLPDQLLMDADNLQALATYLKTADLKLTQTDQPSKVVPIAKSAHAPVNPETATSLNDLLLRYGTEAPDKPHIYFQHEEGHEEVITYGTLLQSSLKVAHGLQALGLKEGETVAIMLPTRPGFFYAFFGTLLAGGVPVPIYPPFRMHMLEAYAKTEAVILSNAQVRVLITFDQAEKLSYLLQSFVPSLKHVTTVEKLLRADPLTLPFIAAPHHFAFIQYTSGSTSYPKGVLLTHANLLANIRAYGKAIAVQADDVTVSWLPLYHDMGLIGMWLGSLYYGLPLVLLTPFSFLNHPERWLWAIHHHRGTLSGAPNFAYELCIHKIEPALLEGLDLSSWRMAANGAEKIYPATLEQFATTFARYGFKRQALLPVYGLAESTVGLTIPPQGQDFIIDYVDRSAFEEKGMATPTDDKEHALAFVNCGEPIEGHDIRITNDENMVLAERQVGRIQFCGPSSMQGYFNHPEATAAIYHDGWWDSGDLGYQANGALYVTGRRKDLIIKAGRNLYPAEIEALIMQVPGVRQGCVIAFGVTDQLRGTEKLVVVAETREKEAKRLDEMKAQMNDIISTTLDLVADEIVLVAPHTVPKTSSGKLQRANCKKMYLDGKLNQTHTPPWLQIMKLASISAWRKSSATLRYAAKLLYTGYVAFLFFISLWPVYLLVRFSKPQRARQIIRHWLQWLIYLAFCKVRITHKENLLQNQAVIYVANHASYLDAVIMLVTLPENLRMVGKKELFDVPVLRTFMRQIECISVDRQDLTKGIEDTKYIETILQSGNAVLIFPEGTFGYASGLRPFRLGAFKMAVETQTPIVPIAIRGTREMLRESEYILRPGKIDLTICKSQLANNAEWESIAALKTSVRNEIAKYCGEPSLDFIVPQTVAVKRIKN